MWNSITRVTFLSVCTLLLGYAVANAQDEKKQPFDPSAPHLTVTHEQTKDGESTVVSRQGEEAELTEKAMREYLDNLADHRDEESEWEGKRGAKISENPLVLKVDALADIATVESVLKQAGEVKIYRFAIGTSEYISKDLDGKGAPDLDDLPDGYAKLMMPKDGGLSSKPTTPPEEMKVYLSWRSKNQRGSFIVADDPREQAPVKGTWIGAKELKSSDPEKRDAVQKALKDGILAYIKESRVKAKVVEVRIADRKDDESTPWAMLNLVVLAMEEVNTSREADGKRALRVMWPWQLIVPEILPPRVPDDGPVEFPKD